MKKFELEATDENIKDTIMRDSLNRNSKLTMLAKMLLNQNNNIVLSIDGNWGSGKTFFVKQFEYLIKNISQFQNDSKFKEDAKKNFTDLNEKNIVIYYNAWENDDHVDPLESIMYTILNDFPEEKNQLVNFEEIKSALKGIINDVIKVGSLGMIDIKNFDEMKNYKDLTSKIITAEEKKDVFNELIDNILINDQRLILIIDELDRCKPTFAVNILETIKHFYNNNKITILFSTNNKELAHTIKKFYGNDFDGYRYLDKFYDVIINLDVIDVKLYLQKELNFAQTTYLYHDISYLLMKYYRFSLRECNKFVTIYNLLVDYIEYEPHFDKEENYVVTAILIPMAIALKITNVDKYYEFINNNGQNEIIEFLDKAVVNTQMERWIKEITKAEDNYKNYIIDCYKKAMNNQREMHVTPFFEAISLLGTRIDTNNDEK